MPYSDILKEVDTWRVCVDYDLLKYTKGCGKGSRQCVVSEDELVGLDNLLLRDLKCFVVIE